jgi:hypothetical protein
MKNFYIIFLLIGLTITGCTKETNEELLISNETTIDDSRRFDPSSPDCYTPVGLIAGQHHDAGIVSYQITNGELVVIYTATGGWEIGATHLYVGDCNAIPTNRRGNPKVGHFPYKSTEAPGTTEVVWTIPISEFPECGCIAAHAELSLDTGNGNQNETGWAAGEQLPGNSWAMFFDYCVSDCLPN